MLEFIKRDFDFWKAEAKHNTTVHTCCIIKNDECIDKCVLPRKEDVVIASFLGMLDRIIRDPVFLFPEI